MPHKDPAQHNAAGKAWRKAHPEYYREYRRQYRKRYPEREAKAREQQKRAYAANPRKRIEAVLRSRKRSPEAYAAFRAYLRLWLRQRQARERGAPGSCSLEQWEARLAMWGDMCWLKLPGCTGKATHVDHVIPVSRGGSNWPANLRPACKHCNCSKGGKDWRPFAQRLAA